jgi:cytochrome c peroxidase
VTQAATAIDRTRRLARVLVAAFAVTLQSQARAGDEPITPIPLPAVANEKRLALGERLFADRRLSRSGTHSCTTCHDLNSNGAGVDARDLSPAGQMLLYNTPTVFNAALSFRLNWEGKFRGMESFLEEILASPVIMGSSADESARRLRADPESVRQFQDAYGRGPDAAALLDALSVYQRSLLTPGSRFDRWLAGDAHALTREELAGYEQFKSLGCVSCHQGVNVGGNLFQRPGIFHPLGRPAPETVRVPSLRNVAATAPYFHDGSAVTLPDAVKVMGIAQLDRVLTDAQVEAVVAFLNTLTGDYRGRPVRPKAAAAARP